METRRFKDEDISLLGFGIMRLPRTAEDKQDIDIEKAQEMVDYAMAHGVNYFDTAYGYHDGMSENFIGSALARYPRESYFLADKLPFWLCKSEEDVLRYFNEQLTRCGVDYFDAYLIHNVTAANMPLIAQHRMYEQLSELKAQGKIRWLGFSFHDTPDVLEDFITRYQWDVAQIQLNYLDWEEQDAAKQYQLLVERGISVIVMEPLRGGTLAALEGDAADILAEADPNVSQASWGLRYAASLPGVLTVLSGMSNLSHVADNIKTMDTFTPLTQAEREVLDKVITAFSAAGTIPCTGCRYCMDCITGVDIPKVFSVYNHYLSGHKGVTNNWGSESIFRKDYHMLGREKQAHNCIACGQCTPLCPQKIDIPAQMEIITAFRESIKEGEKESE